MSGVLTPSETANHISGLLAAERPQGPGIEPGTSASNPTESVLYYQSASWPCQLESFRRANEVRLQLSVLAYTLGNLWRRLVLPKRIDS